MDSGHQKGLKELFTSTSVLMPVSDQELLVKVDASDSRVGAVLSRCNPDIQKLYPCEKNYDVGDRENREMLTVVLALQD